LRNQHHPGRAYSSALEARVPPCYGATRRDIVWHAPGRHQLTGGNFRVEVHDVVANDEHAVGLHVAHAERGGRTLRDNTVLVFQISDGKATEVWQYWSDPYAADELFS
jgi:ketosteroid isomerase-like protein